MIALLQYVKDDSESLRPTYFLIDDSSHNSHRYRFSFLGPASHG